MGNLAFFANADPFTGSGALPQGAAADVTTGQLGQIGINSSTAPRATHPNHGFFWFVLIAGGAVALVGASTHLRIGKERASVSVGEKGKEK